jgi:hypothetical protein
MTQNVRGIGACHNNLGAVAIASKAYDEASSHYLAAISSAEALIQAVRIVVNVHDANPRRLCCSIVNVNA